MMISISMASARCNNTLFHFFQQVTFSPVIIQYADLNRYDDVIAIQCPGAIKRPRPNTQAFPDL